MCRAEQGRKGRKRDGSGEGLSQQKVRQRQRVSMHGAGMEDTPRDAAIMGHQEGLGFAPSPMAHGTTVHKKGLGLPAMLHAGSLNTTGIVHAAGGTCAVGKNWENHAWYNRLC